MSFRFIYLYISLIFFSGCTHFLRNGTLLRDPRLLPPPAVGEIDPETFADDELDMPYYLIHFHRVANAVKIKGKNKGFIDLSVWRHPKDNQPYNARIMENILSLAYFYANQRPWNPYYGSLELRYRLELALEFWSDIQSPEGKFSEYGPEKWNLAATAFATKFMGETLQWLAQGPEIDPELLRRVIDADRKAIHLVLTDEPFYQFGTNFSNQYSNVWAGALAYLDLYPDEDISRLLMQRLKQSMKDFQSSAGYFYEAGGPDWGYNLGTHHSNLHMAYHYAKDTITREMLAQKERQFSDWIAYNMVPDPDEYQFFLNRGIETRQRHPILEPYGWFLSQGLPLTKEDPLSRAYVVDQEMVQQTISLARQNVRREWPRVEVLPVGAFSAFSPYAFLHRKHERYYPTPLQKQEASAQLPVNKTPFVHQRYDERNQTVYTFVRTTKYYAAFNSGKQLRPQQRLGLGLVWGDEAGTILQTQTADTIAAWGTKLEQATLPMEAMDVSANFFMDSAPISLTSGNRNLKGSELSILYTLNGKGTKQIEFLSDRIRVSVAYEGTFTEQIPILSQNRKLLIIQSNKIVLPGNNGTVTLLFESGQSPEMVKTTQEVGNKEVTSIFFQAKDELIYEMVF